MNSPRYSWFVVAAVISGCATGTTPDAGPSARPAVVTIPLVASRINGSEVGRAMLAERDGSTDVTIWISGVPAGYTRPVHLYTFIHQGACGALSAKPEHALIDRVLAHTPGTAARSSGPFELRNTAPTRLAALQATPHAILVKGPPADGNEDLFCGDIG
jgi:hypothetical protein